MPNSVWVICEMTGYGDASHIYKVYGALDSEQAARDYIVHLAYEKSIYKREYLSNRIHENEYDFRTRSLEIDISEPGCQMGDNIFIVAIEVKLILPLYGQEDILHRL